MGKNARKQEKIIKNWEFVPNCVTYSNARLLRMKLEKNLNLSIKLYKDL